MSDIVTMMASLGPFDLGKPDKVSVQLKAFQLYQDEKIGKIIQKARSSFKITDHFMAGCRRAAEEKEQLEEEGIWETAFENCVKYDQKLFKTLGRRYRKWKCAVYRISFNETSQGGAMILSFVGRKLQKRWSEDMQRPNRANAVNRPLFSLSRWH